MIYIAYRAIDSKPTFIAQNILKNKLIDELKEYCRIETGITDRSAYPREEELKKYDLEICITRLRDANSVSRANRTFKDLFKNKGEYRDTGSEYYKYIFFIERKSSKKPTEKPIEKKSKKINKKAFPVWESKIKT